MNWVGGLSRTYCGPAPDASAMLAQWNLDPFLLTGLGLFTFLASRLPPERRLWGLAAVAVAVAAFVSPLCPLTSALFAARSAHHVIVMAVLAPLLALAWPTPTASRMPIRFAGFVAPLWLWHVPGIYAAALGNVGTYWVLQLLLVAGGWLFWAGLFRASVPAAIAAATAASAQAGLLGALITFASRPLYAPHFSTTVSYGVGPLADQQLGGLIMWVPGALIFAGFAALLMRQGFRVIPAPT